MDSEEIRIPDKHQTWINGKRILLSEVSLPEHHFDTACLEDFVNSKGIYTQELMICSSRVKESLLVMRGSASR